MVNVSGITQRFAQRAILVLAGMLIGGVLNLNSAYAEPESGDRFREYTWRPEGKWQRVTWPDVEEPRAQAFLPNTLNTIRLDDLQGARKVEVVIEMLLCHGGTVDKQIRINGGDWMPIAESPYIPGNAGTGPPDSEYQWMRYPMVDVPLDSLQAGDNQFEFTCGPGTALGKWWPQWLLYGVTFRVYYDDTKPATRGKIADLLPGATLGDRPTFHVDVERPDDVAQVDLFAFYDDFNWAGDGLYRQWQSRTLYGELKNHVGSSTTSPFQVTWDTSWVPTQTKPVKLVARIKNRDGLYFVTDVIDGLTLARPYSVEMCKPYDMPRRWSSRAGQRHGCDADVAGNIDRAIAAQITMSTWNGVAADEIGINDEKVVGPIGKDHDLSYDTFDVPLDLIRAGRNRLYTFSTTEHHGIEVQWPGMVLFIKYDLPETGDGEPFPAYTSLKSNKPGDLDSIDRFQSYALTHDGDPVRGRKLFEDHQTTKCVSCHKVGDIGSEVGPDLSNIGFKFDRPHLIESLLEPSKQIVEGYRTVIVQMADGRIVTGVVTNQTDTEITLADVDGKLLTLSKDEIEDQVDNPLSLMPVGLHESLNEVQFTDLVAYLETLRPGKKSPGSDIRGGITLADGFQLEVISIGLTGCTAMEALPDGRLLLCEQTGTLRMVKNGKLLEEPVLTLKVDYLWERGLIGVTIDPSFPESPYIYLCYVSADPFPHHVVSRFTLKGNRVVPGSEKVLLVGDDQRTLGGNVPAGHQGGAVHFGLDGKLYVAIGEQTAGMPSQDLNTFQGKMLRINRDGSIPSDNPFVGQLEGKYQAIWALGLRNPFTFAVHPFSGDLFTNDVGGKFEEINRVASGRNYGWPVAEHGHRTDKKFVGSIHQYPQASISGGDFCPADSDWPEHYHGRYFFADFVHGWIKTLDPDQPGHVESFAGQLRRPVDMRFSPDGSLYVLLRNAWVIDDKFQTGTGSLLRFDYIPK